MVSPMLAVFEVLNFLMTQEKRKSVQEGSKRIEALQYVQRVVGLWGCQCKVDMYAFAAV